MAHSTLLGIDPAPAKPAGSDNATLGPGDSSDSGSDRAGLPDDSDSDAAGTGERAGVEPLDGADEPRDIGVDRVFTPGRGGAAQGPGNEGDNISGETDPKDGAQRTAKHLPRRVADRR